MTDTAPITRKQFPILRLSLVLSIIISVLYQVIITYIFTEDSLRSFIIDMLLTISEGIFFTLGIYYFIQINNRYASALKMMRYPIEWGLLVVAGFYFLYLAYCLKSGHFTALNHLLQQGAYRLYICINLVGISFLYILIIVFSFYQQILEKTAKAEQMQHEYASVRLQALKSQVNPHFLFNSLSVLSSLLHSSPELSEKFIIQLSKAYRYILDQKDAELISLQQELDFLDAYFFLIQIRFNKKVLLQKEIDPGALNLFIPPLTLQLLVENAVKHNSMSLAQPLVIHVQVSNGELRVSNNISRREQLVASTGIGLENIRKRLKYVSETPIQVYQNDSHFSVIIPLIKNKVNI